MVRLFRTYISVLLFSFLVLATAGQCFAKEDSASYILGAEDVFTVSVLRHPEFSGDYLVTSSGAVELPVVGNISVTGVSLSELSKLITTKLNSRLKSPEVTVTLKQPRMRRVYVLGKVKAPGVYDLKPGWGFAEAISAAGGVSEGVETRDVKVTLQSAVTKEKTELSLEKALSASLDSRVLMRPGDVIQVDTVELVTVYVTGKVKAPGMLQMRGDQTGILAVIAQAGGATDEASLSSVRIVRLGGGEEVVDLSPSLVQGESAKLPKLDRGDMVIVPELMTKFAVLGYVSKPSYYSIPSGHTMKLSEALALAGGIEKRGRASRIGIVSVANGKEVRRVVDLGKFFRKGDLTQNPLISPGDVVYVPETDHADLGSVLSALSSSAIFFSYIRR